MKLRLLLFVLTTSLSVVAGAEELPKLELKDGDRVVLLGGGFVEREGKYGHLEAAMTARWPDADVTFRNLGWSGDTVFGHARSYFGPPSEGFARLRNHLEWLKPTVILASYGSVASFDGLEGLDKFSDGYKRLISMMKETAPKARIVLLSPPPFETKGEPLPDMVPRNAMLAEYRDRIFAVGDETGCHVADLFATLEKRGIKGRTSDGVHFTPEGYAAISVLFLHAMDWEPKSVPTTDKLEALRKVIVEKNRLFFYRWRPQNETYLHGFRKHEQGNNAEEVPKFDPLVEAKDKEIAKLRSALAE